MDNTILRLVLEQLDIKTLRNIEKYCDRYINYSVDKKQVISKYGLKTSTKEIAELQEYCNFLIVVKQAEIKETAKAISATNSDENITSTMEKTE